MTVSQESRVTIHAGDGQTVAFAYGFTILSASELTVIKRPVSGPDQTLTLGVDFTLSGIGQSGGGLVTYTTAPVSGDTLFHIGATTRASALDLEQAGQFPSSAVEEGFDRLTRIAQEQDERIDRTIVTPLGEPAPALPREADRANRLLAFSGDGKTFTPLGNAGVLDSALAAALNTFSLDTIPWVANNGAVRALAKPAGGAAFVFRQGHTAVGDGGDALLYFDAVATDADDGANVLAPTEGGTGRWRKVVQRAVQRVADFGPKIDESADVSAAIQGAYDVLREAPVRDGITPRTNWGRGVVDLPAGLLRLDSGVTLQSTLGTLVEGKGISVTNIRTTADDFVAFDMPIAIHTTVRDLSIEYVPPTPGDHSGWASYSNIAFRFRPVSGGQDLQFINVLAEGFYVVIDIAEEINGDEVFTWNLRGDNNAYMIRVLDNTQATALNFYNTACARTQRALFHAGAGNLVNFWGGDSVNQTPHISLWSQLNKFGDSSLINVIGYKYEYGGARNGVWRTQTMAFVSGTTYTATLTGRPLRGRTTVTAAFSTVDQVARDEHSSTLSDAGVRALAGTNVASGQVDSYGQTASITYTVAPDAAPVIRYFDSQVPKVVEVDGSALCAVHMTRSVLLGGEAGPADPLLFDGEPTLDLGGRTRFVMSECFWRGGLQVERDTSVGVRPEAPTITFRDNHRAPRPQDIWLLEGPQFTGRRPPLIKWRGNANVMDCEIGASWGQQKQGQVTYRTCRLPNRADTAVPFRQALAGSLSFAPGTTKQNLSWGAGTYNNDDKTTAIAANAVGTALPADGDGTEIPAGQYGGWGVDIKDNGSITIVAAPGNLTNGYPTAKIARDAVPPPDFNRFRIAELTVIRTDAPFVVGTTALNATNVTLAVYEYPFATATNGASWAVDLPGAIYFRVHDLVLANERRTGSATGWSGMTVWKDLDTSGNPTGFIMALAVDHATDHERCLSVGEYQRQCLGLLPRSAVLAAGQIWTPNGHHFYRVTTAGTTAGTAPTAYDSATIATAVTDGTAVLRQVASVPATAALPTQGRCYITTFGPANGDRIFGEPQLWVSCVGDYWTTLN